MAQRRQLQRLIEVGVAHRQMNDHLLHDAVVALAQAGAHARVTAAAVTALIDSSGGTPSANGPLYAVVTPTVAFVDGVTAFSPKAGFDAATAAIEAAHVEIATKLNAMLEAVFIAGGLSITHAPVGDNGTIEAITVALTAATSGCVAADSARAEINKARNAQATLGAVANYIRTAVGLAPFTENSGGKVVISDEMWSLTARAATEAAATSGEKTLTDASVDAALTALRTNIASLAAITNNLMSPTTLNVQVVAVQSPRWKTNYFS